MNQLRKLSSLLQDDEAIASAEYALLVALIGLCAMVAMQNMATQTSALWTIIKAKVEAVSQAANFF